MTSLMPASMINGQQIKETGLAHCAAISAFCEPKIVKNDYLANK
jgi:hypothetical protein